MSDAENSAENSARRVVGRPFAPGVSGNPGGRPRRDRRTAEILDQANEPVLMAAIERAIAGDVGAMKLVLDRSAPVPKGSTAPVDLGTLANPVDCLGAMARISAALVEGIIDADMATRLSGVVTAGVKIVEVADLAERVRELQSRIEGMRR